MGAALAIGGQILGWIWNHKTLAALIGVAIFAAIQTSRLSTRTIERDAAQSIIAGETKQRKLAEADADRWRADAEANRSLIAKLNDRIETQNAAVDKWRADVARLEGEAIASDARTRKLTDDLTAAKRKIEEHANAHPEDDRPLGPVGLMWGKFLFAGPGEAPADPAGKTP